MPIIEDVAFSRLVVGGKVYRSATIVYPHSVDGRWWRKDGMKFLPEDFDQIIAQKPQVVALGIGFSAKASVPGRNETEVRKRMYPLHYCRHPCKAVEKFNEIQKTRTVIGAFHLM